MSTALSLRHPAAGFQWNPSTTDGVWEGGVVHQDPASQSWSHEKHGRTPSGLPTPPDTRTMTGPTLNHLPPGLAISQSHSRAAHYSYDASTAPASAHQRNGSEPSSKMHSRSDSAATDHRQYNSQDWGADAPKAAGDVIASYLQIPESVNKSKGSLAEFAAEITCLFWFETAATLQFAEEIPNTSFVDRGLVPDATPSIGFRKWVTTILTTTQVGKNVILLALMFIYRLKKFNPTVSGKRGSEFRLLTIALMLGNKFLDDNTYTNKTWAEVSGISVTEIHILEVEFLSNMRYDLYVSESEWAEWKAKLGKFGAFYEKAARFGQTEDQTASHPITPVNQSFPHKLPSPPSTHHSISPYPAAHSATNSYHALPNPVATTPYLPRSPVRAHRNPLLDRLERKRSMDFSTDLPPAKRLHQPATSISPTSTILTPSSSTYTPGSLPTYTPQSSNGHVPEESFPTAHRMPRLPIPRIQTTNAQQLSHLAPISFPVARAMSTVYPATTAPYSQPITPVSAMTQMNGTLYQNPIPNLGEVSRENSNYVSAHASPSYGVLTPTRPGLSPSYFLTHRSSPYRPVRAVNTLLIPPPSASMQNRAYNIPLDQIHYQPLSKAATERKTGPVPYLHPDAWMQSHASTPVAVQQHPYRA